MERPLRVKNVMIGLALCAVLVIVAALVAQTFSGRTDRATLTYDVTASPKAGAPKTWLTQYGSSTAFSADTFCLNSAGCITSWSSGSADGTFSTTSADYWKDVRNFFSTTSADYWETQQAARGADGTFSTTSADYWKGVRNFFSTTSTDYWLTLNQGAAFSTTSADVWKGLRDFFSTTSADWWGSTKGYLTTVDISDDTNLAATYPVILTGDTLSFPATSTLYGSGTAGYVLMWNGSGSPVWAATSSASIAWGAITGTLSSQTDLNAKFLTKLGTSSVLTANEVLYATSFNTVASVATGTLSCTSPVSCTSRAVLQGASAISIANAAADGSTKGAASFTAADFDASSGNISLDRAITGTFTGAWAFNNAASTTIAKGLYANTIAASYLMATSTSAWNTLPNIRVTNASTTNLTATGYADFTSATLQSHTYPPFTFPPGGQMSTTTTATTTIAIGAAMAPKGQQFNSAVCWSGGGTFAFNLTDGTNDSDVHLASTTASYKAFSSNNTFTYKETRYIEIGPMTASYLSCGFDITNNYAN